MALNLAHLFYLTGEIRYRELFESLAAAFGSEIKAHPAGYTYFLSALELMEGPVTTIVFAGQEVSRGVLHPLKGHFLPLVVWLSRDGADGRTVSLIAPFTDAMTSGDLSLHCCRDFACSLPVTEKENIEKRLEQLVSEEKGKGYG